VNPKLVDCKSNPKQKLRLAGMSSMADIMKENGVIQSGRMVRFRLRQQSAEGLMESFGVT
jgi:hypothetical protein